MKILNFGALNYDYVYKVEHIVKPGETISSVKMETFCGGKGLNQSIAIARAGGLVYQAGAVGEDGQMLLDICKDNNIDTSGVAVKPYKSGHAIIQVDESSQNCILLYGGTNQLQERSHIDQVVSSFTAGDYILLQNEINELDYIIDVAYQKGMKIILNPSPFDEKLRKCDLDKVSLFIMNEVEGEQISGSSDEEKILDCMKERFPKAGVVLTLGAQGAIYQDEKCSIRQPAFSVKAVDTTAAGDTFTGYFVAGLVKGLEMSINLELCAKAAAIAVTRMGATVSIPTIDEVE
ncbi:ribokinase [Lachnospiraceae bacterium PM6-15]|uniref:ribokinase n=1 Tax=Ohessyouella blattaphilus TaxID=2949333 RepID=UPI003E25BD2D